MEKEKIKLSVNDIYRFNRGLSNLRGTKFTFNKKFIDLKRTLEKETDSILDAIKGLDEKEIAKAIKEIVEIEYIPFLESEVPEEQTTEETYILLHFIKSEEDGTV